MWLVPIQSFLPTAPPGLSYPNMRLYPSGARGEQCGCDGCTDGGGGECIGGYSGNVPAPPKGTPPPSSVNCGGACVTPDTDIDLFDGGTKKASEIVEGDLLLFRDSDGNSLPQYVYETFSDEQPCMEIIHTKGRLVCSHTHRLIVTGGSDVPAMSLDCEEHQLLGEDGSDVHILSLRLCNSQQVFGWNCEPRHMFHCGGIVHHNKIPPSPPPPAAPPP